MVNFHRTVDSEADDSSVGKTVMSIAVTRHQNVGHPVAVIDWHSDV